MQTILKLLLLELEILITLLQLLGVLSVHV